VREDERRRSSEQGCPPAPASDPGQEAAWRELGRIVEEEVHALPEGLRTALLLCYWEGLTNDEAARRLGWPCGTLKTRLAKARKLLHDRLVRRGVTLPAGAITLVLAPSGSEASVPPTLVAATARAVGTAASPHIAALAEAGLQSLTLTRVKIGLVLLVLGTVASGMATLAHRAPVAAEKEERDAKMPPAKEQPLARTDLHGDPLPKRALTRLGTVRWRMGGLFYSCAYSLDGKTLAAASADHNVYLFDPATGKLIRRLSGHELDATSVAYSPDGRTLASACARGEIRIWESATGKLLRQFHAPRGPIWSLIFSRDGKSLLSGGHDSPIILWDPASGKEIRRFSGPKEGARSLALSPDGRTIASSGNGAVQLWEATTGKLIRRLTGQKELVYSLAFSPDGKLLAGGDELGTVSLWDTSTWQVRHRLSEQIRPRRTNRVYALAFSSDGETLAAGGTHHTLHLWEVSTGRKLHEVPGIDLVTYIGNHHGGIPCVAFSPDGRRLAFGQDNRLALLDTRSGEEVLHFEGHRGAVKQVFFGSDGQRLITISDDTNRRVLEWNSASGRLVRPVPGKVLWAHAAALSPDRKIMASTWDRPAFHLGLWDTATGAEIRRIDPPLLLSSSPSAMSFSPDGKLLAVVESVGKAVWLLNAVTGKQVWSMEEARDWAFIHVSFSADGRLLAVVGNQMIQFLEASTGRQFLRVSLPKNRVSFAADLSPDGRTLALASADDSLNNYVPYPAQGPPKIESVVSKTPAITFWETASGKERATLPCPSPCGRVNSLTFSPDGRLLALGGYDQAVHLCDTTRGKWVKRLEGHQGEVKTLAFSPDGRRLASGSLDTTALIWDVTGLVTKKPHPHSLPRKELDTLWSTLVATDAAKAYQAILTLETLPEQTVPLLAERLRRRFAPDAERIAGLVKQLDSEDFAVRQRAAAELRKLHWAAEPALCKVLEDKPSLEVRKRAKELLDEIIKTEPPPELLQSLRAIETLERIGTAEAKEVLRELADRAPETRLTREAKASLDRLARP
ncbi:MAG TPA: sigma factor-like helix-turn-helix DNA-binding protein, partial [Gemmataceae bacterium]